MVSCVLTKLTYTRTNIVVQCATPHGSTLVQNGKKEKEREKEAKNKQTTNNKTTTPKA
jgi:hypothetical protein